jgi:hypothetical protein
VLNVINTRGGLSGLMEVSCGNVFSASLDPICMPVVLTHEKKL